MERSSGQIVGTPSVSVVIATHNRSRLLKETIDSVLKQTFQDFELIVVDDGSTDDTEEVLKSYGDHLHFLRQENRGPSAARNLGISHARAAWISIQDSDDLCAPDHLETLYSFVEKKPDIGMVFANGAYLDDRGPTRKTIIPRAKSKRLANNGVELTDLFTTSIVRLQAALLSKKAFFAIGGLDENLRISMDLDLAFRFVTRFPIAYLDKVVFFYRRHDGNIGRNQELRLLENLRVIEKLVQDFPSAEEILGRKKIDLRKAYRYYRLSKGRWKAGEKDRARSALRQAVLLRPFFLKYRLYQLLGAIFSKPHNSFLKTTKTGDAR
ncbi:MAG TPA: glycosyltransferase [Candidatus Binatia bacterium]|nr:glycosyltransferase [Candidatus Binatia bacterium]